MRSGLRLLGAISLVVVTAAACSGDPSPTPTPSGPPADSVEAFQAYSGLTIPSTASDVQLQVTTAYDRPAYRARFQLPSTDLDAFCKAGQMNRPLRIITISDDLRKTFDYDGDSTTGIAYGKGSLPSNVTVQREVFAVGTKKATAAVQVYSFTIPR